uniref:DUF202 domain-containing protein n=1 Tax=Odontella aurita TaxID=265563 RepID=A0A7S4JYN1_9STRA|mmetsp:Transcript_57164/g.170402  ORF Transcript_57164/g.170402 Transcript_57164/m.170402 type:complete len:119 (+) Transcript_57164:143-499(+)
MSYEAVSLSRHVPNEGSTARDHLANERTLLAWVRTSVSLIALGIAVAKFDPNRKTGLAVGLMLVCLGIVMIGTSRVRYFDVLQSLERGEFRINEGGVNVILGLIVFVSVASLIVMTTV